MRTPTIAVEARSGHPRRCRHTRNCQRHCPKARHWRAAGRASMGCNSDQHCATFSREEAPSQLRALPPALAGARGRRLLRAQ
eukprot:2221610-Pyramimonas_sp.AAC.1